MEKIDRRTFVAGTAALSTFVLMDRSFAQTAEQGPFTLPPLPYPASSLEPHIDARTMELHHGKHHAAYVDNLNKAVKEHSAAAAMPLEKLLASLSELPDRIRTAVRNHGGGHANHTMFWQVMGKGGGAPEGSLKEAIDRDFGGLGKLQEKFNASGAKLFGSGWVFVTVSPEGKLEVVTRRNQNSPLMKGHRVLFGNDVWEHAYYLQYQNRRAEYLSAWWNVVNWKAVDERYAAAKAGKLGI